VRHFEEIARHTDIDLMIYNIPPFTGQTLKPETIFKIAKIDRVVGYKDTSGSFPDFQRCLAHFKGTDFILHQGATNLAVPSMLLGADGYIPSLAPLFPVPHLKVYDYGRAGDIAKTQFWGEILHQACTVYGMAKSQTSSTKYALARLGFFHKRPIRPTEPTLPAEEKAIDQRIDEVMEMIAKAAA
jgi:4-hydroxy-tetrahydrodipicolinate synthase